MNKHQTSDLRLQTSVKRHPIRTPSLGFLKSEVWSLKSARGLTFVELLIAATMFSILMIGFSTYLRGGLIAWRRTMAVSEQLQVSRAALDRLARDVANAILLDPGGTWCPSPIFSAEELSFVTAPPHRAGSTVDRLWVVHYFRVTDGTQTRLVRAMRTIREARANWPERSETLLPSIQRWSCRYGQRAAEGGVEQIQWQTSWTDATQLPYLLEVTIELGAGQGRARRLRRVFVIPPGSLTPAEKSS